MTDGTISRDDRVVLEYTSDPHTDLVPGDRGTVTMIDALGTVHVNWDNGSNLGMVPGEDRIERVYE
jgi:hypothetical protein